MWSKKKILILDRARGLLLLPLILLALTASRAAAESPSLEAIKAGLRQQFGKIDSLYLRVRRTTTLAIEPSVLRSWPSRPDLPTYLGMDELLIAFRCAGRYFRVVELDYRAKPSARVPHTGSETGRYVDVTKVWTGSALRERTRNLESGGWEHRSPPVGQARDCFPPAPYLRNVGMALGDPTATDQAHHNLQGLYRLSELLRRWPYVLADKTEPIDGAACVVLEGRTERDLPVGKNAPRMILSDRIWLDPKLGLALRKRETEMGGQLVRVVNTDFVEVLPGFWLPKHSRMHTFPPADAPQQSRDRPMLTEETTLCLWVVNQVPRDLFDVALTPSRPGPVSAFDLTPAYHWRNAKSAGWGGQVEEAWGLRGVGRRLELRQGSELRLLVLDTPRWHFVWDPKGNRVMASPSRLGNPRVEDWVHERAEMIRVYEERTGVFACQREQLGGKEVDRLTIYFPADPQQGGAWPIHNFEPKAQKTASGMESRTRTYWFDPKTNLMVQRACGCQPPKYQVTVDYPRPEQMPRDLFSWKMLPGVPLEVTDPELGRPLYSEGRPSTEAK